MITGIIRMVYFFQIDILADPTYQSVGIMAWTLVEPGVYLIAATLPSLRPLLQYLFKDVKFKTLYNNLLHCYTRTFSAPKYSEGTDVDKQFNSGNRQTVNITVGNGPRSAGFVKVDEWDARQSEIALREF